MDEQDSILKEFLVECSEGLERLDQEFVTLEKEPTDTALIASIFRTIHTIKGTCGFLGLSKLENVAHRAESVLSQMRDRKMSVTPDRISVLLESVDAIKEILQQLEAAGQEPDKEYSEVVQRLDVLLSGGSPPAQSPASSSQSTGQESARAQAAEAATQAAEAVVPHESDAAPPSAAEPSAKAGEVAGAQTVSQAKGQSVVESSIRVDVGLLDKLMNLVSELVLARNQLLRHIRAQESAGDMATAQRMNLVTTELQETVMKTRMQPVRNVWDKFPRIVRDLARASGKQVELVMEGAETELDKTLLEAIKDPLTHIVRNAVDHGIEAPEVRRQRGKPETGTLRLKAYHESGQINIEISDDGGGIDVERVKRKVVEKGLMSSEEVFQLSERQALNLIFLPGLSTAEKVTNISGRGVGMDVVKSNIEKISGTIELYTRLGEGTGMLVKIPLTLAIIPALLVAAGRELFAIPQAGLLELVRVDEELGERIEVIRGAEFYRLRGSLLPLVHLKKILELSGEAAAPEISQSIANREFNIVVLKAGSQVFGLVVDEVSDSEEIVVKPLGGFLKGLGVYAGVTILGDGRVALILDVLGLAKQGGIFRQSTEGPGMKGQEPSRETHGGELQRLVTFTVSGEDHYAVSLDQVDRLEEFNVQQVERAAGREVVQYRNSLMPLIRMDRFLGTELIQGQTEKYPTLVFSQDEQQKNVGLVVGRILDIVQTTLDLRLPPAGQAGVRGSLVIGGRTADLLDVHEIIETVEPGWMKGSPVG